jgi:hypothetical protein
MLTVKHKKYADGIQIVFQGSNYYRPIKPILEDQKWFENIEDAKSWFVGVSHAYLCGTFDSLFIRLRAISPKIFHGTAGGSPENRNLWQENYWKLKDLKEEYFKNANSVWKRANIILDQHQILINSIPRDHSLDYDFFKNMVADMIKCAKLMKEALKKDIEKQKKEWFEMTSQDIPELEEVNNLNLKEVA